jgi:hypothetical protein
MTTWTGDELDRVGTDELQLASVCRDGSLRPYVTIRLIDDVSPAT